ncbi:UNVERIFIED_CONTAM: hypothetical protein H355_006856 [Colinus virginianus]|nr:hypothetical protein H355_006856 [Colinus virginianus]
MLAFLDQLLGKAVTLTSVPVEEFHLTKYLNLLIKALHEFPNDIFTNEDRRHGAVILHVICAMYMFYALAIVCDDFFVPSLEKICERLHLSEDVAGATFMAAGSSAPELFTSVIDSPVSDIQFYQESILKERNDLNGTQQLCVVAVDVHNKVKAQELPHRVRGDSLHQVTSLAHTVSVAVMLVRAWLTSSHCLFPQVVSLSSWSLLRDSIYYTLSVVALIVFIYDEKVSWWESLVLVLMYAIYIVIMKYNSTIQHCLERKTKNAANMVNGLANNTEMDDNSNCDATVVLLKKGNFHRKASVIMVDELLSAYPHQLSFSEAGLRIMITSHFPPKTRLSMASRMLINEVTIIGYTLGIPDVIMGITFLAAGTSVPDCMASLIVARQGMGDMAVSNSIGSNVFDILIGLGLPWALQTLAVNYGSYIRLNSRGLIYSVGLLLASVFVTVFGVHMNKWKLDKKLGCVCLSLYGIFLCFSIMTEFNVFTFVNLPMCRDH